MVHLGGRFDDRGGPTAVGALGRRNTVGMGLPGLAAVGSRAGHGAEVNVTGGGKIVHAVGAALGVGPSIDLFEEGVEDLRQNGVGVVVVVAVLGGLVPQHQAGGLAALEIGGERLQQIGHGQRFAIENVILDGGEAIRTRAGGNRHDVGGIVARATVVVVLAFGDAILDQQRQERRRHVARVEPLDDVVAADLDIDEMM